MGKVGEWERPIPVAAVPCESPRLVTRALGARLTADIVPARGDIAATHAAISSFMFFPFRQNQQAADLALGHAVFQNGKPKKC